MSSPSRASAALRRALAGASLAALAALAACTTPPPAPPPVAEAPPPPPAPVLALSAQTIEQASAYRDYMDRTSAITADFKDGAQVQSALKLAAAQEPAQFQRGMVAYGAIVALQDQAFVAGVRRFAVTLEGRQKLAQTLWSDPAYGAVLPGADTAAGLVAAALAADAEALRVAGAAVKQSAYDVQRAKWSKATVTDRDGRLAQAKALSAASLTPSSGQLTRLTAASLSGGPLTEVSLAPAAAPAVAPYSTVVARALTVAALAVLGEAADSNTERLAPVLADSGASSCLTMAKLNLYQCLAVSKPHYEDIFCLGQHIMLDTAQCVTKGSGLRMTPVTIAQAEPLNVPPVGGAASVGVRSGAGATTTTTAVSKPAAKGAAARKPTKGG